MRRVTGANSRFLIRRVAEWLRARGWSAGEATLDTAARWRRWRVQATHCTGQIIQASAATQSGVWDLVGRRVGGLPAVPGSLSVPGDCRGFRDEGRESETDPLRPDHENDP